MTKFTIAGLKGAPYHFKSTNMEYLRCPYCRIGNVKFEKKRRSDDVIEWKCNVCGMYLEEEGVRR